MYDALQACHHCTHSHARLGARGRGLERLLSAAIIASLRLRQFERRSIRFVFLVELSSSTASSMMLAYSIFLPI